MMGSLTRGIFTCLLFHLCFMWWENSFASWRLAIWLTRSSSLFQEYILDKGLMLCYSLFSAWKLYKLCYHSLLKVISQYNCLLNIFLQVKGFFFFFCFSSYFYHLCMIFIKISRKMFFFVNPEGIFFLVVFPLAIWKTWMALVLKYILLWPLWFSGQFFNWSLFDFNFEPPKHLPQNPILVLGHTIFISCTVRLLFLISSLLQSWWMDCNRISWSPVNVAYFPPRFDFLSRISWSPEILRMVLTFLYVWFLIEEMYICRFDLC